MQKLGLSLTIFVSLRVNHSLTTSEVVEAGLKAIPHVVACHVVSGDADFLVELAVPDLRTYEHVLTNGILAIGPVAEARSTFSIRTVIDRGPLPLSSWLESRQYEAEQRRKDRTRWRNLLLRGANRGRP